MKSKSMITSLLLVLVLSFGIAAMQKDKYVVEKTLFKNESYEKQVVKTILEPYNVTNSVKTIQKYVVREEYVDEVLVPEKEWYVKDKIPLKDLMITSPTNGYWSSIVGVCFISFKIYNPNLVPVNFSLKFVATQVETKQSKVREVPLVLNGTIDGAKEGMFSQAILAGEYEDSTGELVNWTVGTCNFKSLVGITYIPTKNVTFRIVEVKRNVTKYRNVTKTKILNQSEINAQPRFITKYRNISVTKTVVVPKFSKIVEKKTDYGLFVKVLLRSFVIAVVLVALLYIFVLWMVSKINAKKMHRKRNAKPHVTVKGTRIDLKRK